MSMNNKKALEGVQVRTPSARTMLYRRLPVAPTANFGPDVPYIIEAAISRPSSDRKRASDNWPVESNHMNDMSLNEVAQVRTPSARTLLYLRLPTGRPSSSSGSSSL